MRAWSIEEIDTPPPQWVPPGTDGTRWAGRPPRAGVQTGTVIMATLLGMALGGWMSGAIFDMTGSYKAAFVNGIAWNLLNLCIAGYFYRRARALGQLRQIA